MNQKIKMVILFGFLSLALSKVAIPTNIQLDYLGQELGAIIHFNMATFLEAQGCSNFNSNASLFNPTNLTIDSWIEAAASFGAKHAVLTTKHGCGFTLWPTNVTITDVNNNTFRYNYSVAYSNWENGLGDVIELFVKSCKKYNVKPGFYYNMADTAFLNIDNWKIGSTLKKGMINVTLQEYYEVVYGQLRELFGNYAKGELFEIWFDGGYSKAIQNNVRKIVEELAPQAVVFGGNIF